MNQNNQTSPETRLTGLLDLLPDVAPVQEFLAHLDEGERVAVCVLRKSERKALKKILNKEDW